MQGKTSFWMVVCAGVTVGILVGFAVPLAASYEPKAVFQVKQSETAGTTLEILPLLAVQTAHDVERDSEVARLAARNRRLEALLAALRQKKASVRRLSPQMQLQSKAVFGTE